jgi:hypothetical protein
MAAAKWIRPSAETVEHFERIAPGPPLQIRRMFGMPCRFLNGHMLVGLYQNSIMLHLSAADRAACIEAGARPLIASGREMKEYVEILPRTFDDHTLKLWIVQGMRYLGSLPPNLPLEMSKPASGPRLKLRSAKRPPSGSRAAAPLPSAAAKPRKRSPAHPALSPRARKPSKKPTASATSPRITKAARARPQVSKPAPKPKAPLRKRSR